MRYTALAALVALACGQTAGPTNRPPQAASESPIQVSRPAIISATSVGALREHSRATTKELEKFFPGYQIQSVEHFAAGTIHVSKLSRQGVLALVIHTNDEGRVSHVVVLDREAATPSGVGVGATYADFERAAARHECHRIEDGEDVVCHAEEPANVGYVFGRAARGYWGKNVPPRAYMSVSAITEIWWFPEPLLRIPAHLIPELIESAEDR